MTNIAFIGVCCGAPSQKERTAIELLPKSIIAYAKISNLDELTKLILEHPLRERLLSLPEYRAALKSGPFKQLQLGLAAFEGSMELPWDQAVTKLTDGGITLALDGSQGGFVVLLKSSDEATIDRFRSFVLALGQLQNGGKAAKEGDYRKITAYSLSDQLKMAQMGHWLFLTNKSELGKAVIDQYLDGTHDSLQSNQQFQHALAKMESVDAQGGSLAAYVDVAAMQKAGIAKGMFSEKLDNIAAEVVLGGILANLRHAPYATANLKVNVEGARLRLVTPHQRDWEAPREYFFGAPALASAPPLIEVKERLFALSAHRDLSQMWLRAGDLLTDKANDSLAKADTQLTTFFSGRDFGEDILGSLSSGIQFVAKTQDFTGILPSPAIKLPTFAIQFAMKNPAETQPELRRVFQSFAGFFNVTSGANGRPQLDVGMESLGKAQLITASFVPDRAQRDSEAAPIFFNFSPTLAFIGDRVILSSSLKLAKELVMQEQPAESPLQTSNTAVTLDASVLRTILAANKSQLVASNMLSKGQSQDSAEAEIGLLLELITFLKDAQLKLDTTDSQMQLSLDLHLGSGNAK